MSRGESRGNRHELRVWLKLALESGVLERVPPRCDPEGTGSPGPTDDYARRLIAELKDPESSDRTLPEIILAARRFRDWIEYRQKASRRIILGGWQTEGAAAWSPERRTPARPALTKRPARSESGEVGPGPTADPMWDDWLDG